jgi:hypothetical protein
LPFTPTATPLLRPLRDLDVLVPRDQAMLAFESLLQEGFVRDPTFPGDLSAAYEYGKHLPPLTAPRGRICAEVPLSVFRVSDIRFRFRIVAPTSDIGGCWKSAFGAPVQAASLPHRPQAWMRRGTSMSCSDGFGFRHHIFSRDSRSEVWTHSCSPIHTRAP